VKNELLIMQHNYYTLQNSDFSVPEGVKSIIISRLDRLELNIKKIVQAASILGTEINIAILSRLVSDFDKECWN